MKKRTSNAKRYYLAYGSNLNTVEMKYRCPSAKVIGTAEISGWRLLFRGNWMGYLTIEPCEGACVPVAVWEVSPDDESSLDSYEGFPDFYDKQDMRLPVRETCGRETSERDAFIYIMKERFSKAQGGISPTALATYLRCQLRFYYRYVSNLIEPDDTDEELIDNRVFGNIFHKAAEIIYTQLKALTGNNITRSAIDKMLESGVEIERAVDEAFRSEYGHPIIDGLQLINREVIIKYVHLLLETDRQYTPFSNILLEKKVSMPWGDTIIGGIVDRLDRDDNGIRVIDYKTGTRLQKKLPDIEAIFDPRNVSGHSDYYLQAFLYSCIVRQKLFYFFLFNA